MTYINTEQMQRAAGTFDSAVEQLQRVVNQLDQTVWQLLPLLGQGYGNNLERLIEQLEEFNKINKPPIAEMYTEEEYWDE